MGINHSACMHFCPFEIWWMLFAWRSCCNTFLTQVMAPVTLFFIHFMALWSKCVLMASIWGCFKFGFYAECYWINNNFFSFFRKACLKSIGACKKQTILPFVYSSIFICTMIKGSSVYYLLLFFFFFRLV